MFTNIPILSTVGAGKKFLRHVIPLRQDLRNLLRYIRDGQVIPIVGPGLATVDEGGGSHLPIDRVLAPLLAGALGLEPDVTRIAALTASPASTAPTGHSAQEYL